MRARWVMANWKMNGSSASINALLDALCGSVSDELAQHGVLFPPAIYLPLLQARLKGTPWHLGAQNVYSKSSGAYTGEHACAMLAEFACEYVLVGHSERRQLFHEDEKLIAEKFHQVKEHGMIPVLCVGETAEQRAAGETFAVLTRQLSSVLRDAALDFAQCVVAYEPVWAIGTGLTATPDEAQVVHQFIRAWVATQNSSSAARLPILYGGSVNASNARALLTQPDIDGGLVGGASLDAGQFLEIMKCIK